MSRVRYRRADQPQLEEGCASRCRRDHGRNEDQHNRMSGNGNRASNGNTHLVDATPGQAPESFDRGAGNRRSNSRAFAVLTPGSQSKD